MRSIGIPERTLDRVILACAVLLTLASCAGSEDYGALAAEICDGSDELRILASVLSPAARVNSEQRVILENGSYLVLDGQCRYWVMNPDFRWGGSRSGQLSHERLAEMLRDFRYDVWPEHSGRHRPQGGAFDVSDIVFSDGVDTTVCVGGCGAPEVPEEVRQMRDALLPWRLALWESGEPVEGDVRISVTERFERFPDRFPSIPWPLETIALEDVAVSVDDSAYLDYGEGVLVTGENAARLRELRQEFAAGAHGVWWYHFIPVLEDGVLYSLSVRDVTPFEDERGLFPWLYPE